MSLFLSKEYLQGVEDLAFGILTRMEDDIMEAIIDGDGLQYGDVALGRDERILKFMDDAERGIHAFLDQDELEGREREFRRDAENARLT